MTEEEERHALANLLLDFEETRRKLENVSGAVARHAHHIAGVGSELIRKPENVRVGNEDGPPNAKRIDAALFDVEKIQSLLRDQRELRARFDDLKRRKQALFGE